MEIKIIALNVLITVLSDLSSEQCAEKRYIMKYIQSIFILSINVELLRFELINPLKQRGYFENENNSEYAPSLEFIIPTNTVRAEDSHTLLQKDPFAERQNLEFEEPFINENNWRVAEPDPTFHKHKLKQKIHAHIHTSTHVHGLGDLQGQSSAISPISTVIPGNQQIWHQTQNVHTGFHNQYGVPNNGYSAINQGFQTAGAAANIGYGLINKGIHSTGSAITSGFGVTNQGFHSSGVGAHNGFSAINQGFQSSGPVYPNPNHYSHLNSNPNIHLNSQLINNQNNHLINANNQFSTGHNSFQNQNGVSIGVPNTLNVQISNVNGHGNSLSQSQISSKHSAVPETSLQTKPEFLDDNVSFLDIRSADEPNQYPHKNSKRAEYDTDMENILNALDIRSYLQERPEVQTSPYYEKGYISEESTSQPQNCPCSCDESRHNDQKDEKLADNLNHENQDQQLYDNIKLQSPYLIQIPYNGHYQTPEYRYRRTLRSIENKTSHISPNDTISPNISDWDKHGLNYTLQDYRKMIDSYRNGITQKEEMVFADFLEGIVEDYQKKDILNSNEIKKVEKRSVPIVKLLHDPNVKLDVPKTLENIGTITKNAFEDKRAPMYHVRNLMGSTKNAVLSAMRIPPQNLIVPSNYEVRNIKPEEINDETDEVLGDINRKILSRSSFQDDGVNKDSSENEVIKNDPYGIVDTFTRVGSAIRDSVRSGQNTLSHIGDIVHDGKKIFHSTKYTVPRVILPYAKAPVLGSRFKVEKPLPLKKTVIIKPKVLDFKEPYLGSVNHEPYFVKVGNILDALGISKPDQNRINLEKIVMKTSGKGQVLGIYVPPIGDVKPVNAERKSMQKSVKKESSRAYGNVPSFAKVGTKQDDQVSQTDNILEQIIGNNRKIKNTQQKVNVEYGSADEHRHNDNSRFKVESSPHNKNRRKHFTMEEENEIIDEFLNNIFKADDKLDKKSKVVSPLGKQMTYQGDNCTNITQRIDKERKKGTVFKNFNKPPKNLDITSNSSKSELEEMVKKLSIDFLKDEGKSQSRNHGINRTSLKTLKKNKVDGSLLNKKTKVHRKSKPGIALQSRFGADEEQKLTTTDVPLLKNDLYSNVNKDDIVENDEEAMRKMDEYVKNDIISSSDWPYEPSRHGWRIGNVLQLVEDEPNEESSSEINVVAKDNEDILPGYHSKSSVWSPQEQENVSGIIESNLPKEIRSKRSYDEIVGLNLPSYLTKPFMARASNPDVEHIFRDHNKEEIVGSVSPEFSTNTNRNQNFQGQDLHHHNQFNSFLPSELIKTMNFWSSNPENENVARSNSPNLEYHQNRYFEYNNPPVQQELEYVGTSRMEDENSDYILCSPSHDEPNSPLLCRKVYKHPTSDTRFSDNVREFEDNSGSESSGTVGQSRTSMLVADNLRKPFMGLGNEDTIKKFFQKYEKEESNVFSDSYNTEYHY
ncbi:hypothetical protein HHI36_014485 [Cryptolaemus montrouzieri]|uniref:Uncharacterized protein n=1 Tax=Cryptolaemus montrouzieri TaxID=559131 RepID=A0ABD2N303_9CUCU